jgi:glucose dehydrogenase
MWANRNGFFYVLDRRTARFLLGQPLVKVNWASGLDSDGRPISDTAVRGKDDVPRH